MENSFNIYCDKSCHLLRDDGRAMVIGAIWCPSILSRKIADDIREIRQKHGLKKYSELKWRGVSNSKLDFYLDVIEYFNKTAALCFRAVIIPDKSLLDHGKFDQTHDDFYYKMYFQMLRAIISDPAKKYRIFLDIKDTRSAEKLAKLRMVLSYNLHDFSQDAIPIVQNVRSHEIQQIQLADLLVGAISYANSYSKSDKTRSKAKWAVIGRMRSLWGLSLTASTDIDTVKFNLFKWKARESPDV